MSESVLSEFQVMGCKNRTVAALALQVYIELCEVKKYWDVEYHYDDRLECIYFTANKTKGAKPTIFVPVATSAKLSFELMQKYLLLSKEDDSKSVCLVISSPDSTSVFYEISDGLGEPPSTAKICKAKAARSELLDRTLHKHRTVLEQGAMYGLPITLPKEERGCSGKSEDPND